MIKIKFNTLKPMEMDVGDKFQVNLNSSAPKNEQPIITIKVIEKDYVEVMVYKSEGKLLTITKDEIKKMGIGWLVEAYTIDKKKGEKVNGRSKIRLDSRK